MGVEFGVDLLEMRISSINPAQLRYYSVFFFDDLSLFFQFLLVIFDFGHLRVILLFYALYFVQMAPVFILQLVYL